MDAATKSPQIQVIRRTPEYWRVTFANPPLNVMGPQMVREFTALIDAIEGDQEVFRDQGRPAATSPAADIVNRCRGWVAAVASASIDPTSRMIDLLFGQAGTP